MADIDQIIAEGRELAEAASPRPWAYFSNKYGEQHVSVPRDSMNMNAPLASGGVATERPEADAKYTAHTANNFLSLCDEVQRLRAENDALLGLYTAVGNDECSVTYCAGGRGGLVHQAWEAARAVLGDQAPDALKRETAND